MRNVAGNARASSVCKNHTATFLILDITDKLSTHHVLAKSTVVISKSFTQLPLSDHSLLFSFLL